MTQIYNEQKSMSEYNVLVYRNYRKYSVSLFLNAPKKVGFFFTLMACSLKNKIPVNEICSMKHEYES